MDDPELHVVLEARAEPIAQPGQGGATDARRIESLHICAAPRLYLVEAHLSSGTDPFPSPLGAWPPTRIDASPRKPT